jgi:hypothetical protein
MKRGQKKTREFWKKEDAEGQKIAAHPMAEQTVEALEKKAKGASPKKKRKAVQHRRAVDRAKRSEGKAERLTASKDLAQRGKERFAVSDPSDIVDDNRYKVPVSRQGDDRGPIKRDTFTDQVENPDKDDATQSVQRVRTILDRLILDGSISANMKLAGDDFARHFSIAGYDRIKTVDLMGGGAGGGDHAARAALFIERTLDSRIIVDKYLKLLCWPNSNMGKAVVWMLGYGKNIKDLASSKDLHELSGGGDLRYWKGTLVSALQVMAFWYQQNRVKSSEMRGTRHFHDSDMMIVEGPHSGKRKF